MQFLKHHQLCPLSGGLANQRQGVFQVGVKVSAVFLLDNGNSHGRHS